MEPTTALTAAKVANAAFDDSRSLLKRVLGPSADTMGKFFADWFEIKTRNVIRIAEKADERLAQSKGNPEEAVPMRVAMRIFDEGAYCDDESEIVVEYLGGILASARRLGPKNDVANSYAAVVSRMAADHLFMHYMLYRQTTPYTLAVRRIPI